MKKNILLVLFIVCFCTLYAQDPILQKWNCGDNQVTNITFQYTSTENSKYTLSSSGILPQNFSSDFTGTVFSPQGIVNDPNAYPWRTTVAYNDNSAFLIDPYHILMAGHEVEFQQNWYSYMPCLPGYEGTFDIEDQPYKYARAEEYYRISSFNNCSQYDYCIIKLDRPIGALVGWNGYGYNNDNSFFLNNLFFTPGYPNGGNSQPFDHNYLYNWKGYPDYVSTNYIQSNRKPFGGLSGSPLNAVVENNYVSYGIVTCGTTAVGYNRITSNIYDAITKVIELNTPSQFDLIPLWTKVSPRYISSGNALQKISFVLHNYSSQGVRFSNITVSVYISTDNVITNTDELLTTFTYTDRFSAKGSVLKEETVSLPVINKPTGDYYIGLIISGDNNTGNNTTKSLDVAKITVNNENNVTMKGSVSSLNTNNGICNVTLEGFPNSTKTDFNGLFETQVPYNWSGSVTATKGGFNFTPLWYSNVTQTTGIKLQSVKNMYTISGYVYDIDNNPLSGVLMNGFPGNNYTDDNGYYSVNVYHNWSGAINPTLSNYNFPSHNHSNITGPVQYNYTQTSDDDDDGDISILACNIPKEFNLSQNYPNPFNPVTNIKYDIPKDVMVSINVFDITGREIAKLVNEYKKAGCYNVAFNGSNFASGIYFYRIQAGDFVQIKKMVLIK
jgi:hypothetical protein